jgi:hypothetical protein
MHGKKKQKTHIREIEKDLRKTIGKRDPILKEETRDLMYELSKEDADQLCAYLFDLTKARSKFADRFVAAVSELEDRCFSETQIQAIIDYCFRFGNGDIQRVGVVILRQYKEVGNLRSRYQLTFLKDKGAAKYLIREVYSE